MVQSHEIIIRTEHLRQTASGEMVGRPLLDTMESRVLHERVDDVPFWRQTIDILVARYTKHSSLSNEDRIKYGMPISQFLLVPDYSEQDDPSRFGCHFVSKWVIERESPHIEVRDHVELKGFTQEERWGIDQRLIRRNYRADVVPGMFEDAEETMKPFVVPEEALDEFAILTKMDQIERLMSDYRKQNPDSDLFNESAILNTIGKRKEYSDLKKQLSQLEQ